MEDKETMLIEEKEIIIPEKFPRTYQLSDVFYDTDIINEVVGDMRFQKHLERLSKLSSSHPERIKIVKR